MLGELWGVLGDSAVMRSGCAAPTGVIYFDAGVGLLHDVIGIGYRLRAARSWAKLSLRALAYLTGCNESTLSRYECGLVARPSMTLLILCAEKLGVHVAWLMGMESVPASADEKANAWMELAISELQDGRVVQYKRLCV